MANDSRTDADYDALSLPDALYYEIEGVLQDTKDGEPMDDVCRQTLMCVQAKLSSLSTTGAKAQCATWPFPQEIEHWRDRALKAEAELAVLQARNGKEENGNG